jgi:hypothetical protein
MKREQGWALALVARSLSLVDRKREKRTVNGLRNGFVFSMSRSRAVLCSPPLRHLHFIHTLALSLQLYATQIKSSLFGTTLGVGEKMHYSYGHTVNDDSKHQVITCITPPFAPPSHSLAHYKLLLRAVEFLSKKFVQPLCWRTRMY